MGWFDTTPSGRILSRTNKDQDDIDVALPMSLNFSLSNIFSIIGYLITVTIIFPYFLIIFFILSIVYIIVVNKYLNVAREFKRIEVIIIHI
jgi:ABC-type multidrug transport system fused ATPase/permease subunit